MTQEKLNEEIMALPFVSQDEAKEYIAEAMEKLEAGDTAEDILNSIKGDHRDLLLEEDMIGEAE